MRRGGDTLHSNLNFKCETRLRDNFCFQCVNLESKNNNERLEKNFISIRVYIYISREVTILLDSEETKSAEDVGGASKLLISKFRNPINWNLSPSTCIYIFFKRRGQRSSELYFIENISFFVGTTRCIFQQINSPHLYHLFQWMRETFHIIETESS